MKNSKFLDSRKFCLIIAMVLSVSILGGMHIVTPDQYLEFLKWVFGIYVAGNVIDKFAPKKDAS